MLRLARPDDSRHLASIAQESYSKYLGLVDDPPAPMLLDYDVVAAAGHTYVVEECGGLQGMVTVEANYPYLVLRNLAVRRFCQRQGIGTRLVFFVEELARQDGLRGIELWTRAEMSDNIAFYTRLNYVLTHSEQTSGANRVFFRKELVTTPQVSTQHA